MVETWNNTKCIMFDTTIFEKVKKLETECFKEIFANVEVVAEVEYGAVAKKRYFDNLIEYQKLKIIQELENNNEDYTNIIFMAHHPLISVVSKKNKNIIKCQDSLLNFFYNIFTDLKSRGLINLKKFIYICANTHLYQKGSVNFDDINISVEQYIVGTGGADLDNLPDINMYTYTFDEKSINYNIQNQEKCYGYLTHNSEITNNFEFCKVPILIPVEEQKSISRKYKIIYN